MLRHAILGSVSWVHVRSHGRETDPAKQHLLPLNERADRLAERGRSGEPCFVLQRWVYTVGIDEPELAVERCRWCRRIFLPQVRPVFMRLVVGLRWENNRPLNVGNAG